MNYKVASKNDFHGVKLVLDVSLETSTLKDISNNPSNLYKTLSLTLIANDTEIEGVLWFKQGMFENSIVFGVTLYNVEDFSTYFDLNFENTVNDKIQVTMNRYAQILPMMQAICNGTTSFKSAVGLNVKVKNNFSRN